MYCLNDFKSNLENLQWNGKNKSNVLIFEFKVLKVIFKFLFQKRMKNYYLAWSILVEFNFTLVYVNCPRKILSIDQ